MERVNVSEISWLHDQLLLKTTQPFPRNSDGSGVAINPQELALPCPQALKDGRRVAACAQRCVNVIAIWPYIQKLQNFFE